MRWWNHDAIAQTELDTIVPMDFYSTNETNVPHIAWLYQHYYVIERIGFGLNPYMQTPPANSPTEDGSA
eukprot:SAG22_NODE_872_length_6726_cov_2.255923_2_plen_69_part_00